MAEPPEGRSVRLRGNAVTVLSMVLWATTFPVTDLVLLTWHPLLVTMVRLVLAVPVLLVLLAARGHWHEIRTAPWGDGFLVGGLALSGSALFLVFGIAFADPVTVAIIAATTPAISAAIGLAARTERLTLPLALGIALAIAGALATNWRAQGLDDVRLHGGEALVVLANVCWIWYSRGCMVRLGGLSDLGKTTLTVGCGAIVTAAVAALALAAGLIPAEFDVSLRSIGLILWMAAVANGIAVVFWLWGARLLGVTIASMHQNLVPLYVILMVLPLGGEVHGQQLIGGALVVAGAILAQLPGRANGHRPTV